MNIALEPLYVQVLDQDEFKALKDEVDKFLTHVTGTKERSPKILLPQSTLNLQGPYSVLNAEIINKPLASSLNFQRSQSVVNVKGMFGELHFLDKQNETSGYKGTRLEDWISNTKPMNGKSILRKRNKFVNKLEAISSQGNELDDTINKIKTPSSANGADDLKKQLFNNQNNSSFVDSGISNHLNNKSSKSTVLEKMEKRRLATKAVDEERDSKLKEKGTIGSISDLVIQRASFQISARKVNFPWAR